ncbi:OmpA family protein [Vibrio sp. SM6]|uniref:OmpA family protein n=1 Tax=Vibrio agarilyticus TaxID=2726741 RepID=A0A7X8TQP1_9VIBR|nr:OmpA family protein [Vibrio agarilyticus]NLS13071.1 OmpA family protein [Vibrio agarilyticus]
MNLVKYSVLLFALQPITSLMAQDATEIIRYCAKPGLNEQQSVRFGAPQAVALNQGGFMLLEKESDYEITEALIERALIEAGIDPDCAEYLLTKSQITHYDAGELVARVYFAFDRAELTQESQYVLDTLVSKMRGQEQFLLLEGHTDNVGTAVYNFDLGWRRATSVNDYLVQQALAPNRLEAVSKGENEPIATNQTAKGRQANRRVDVVILE